MWEIVSSPEGTAAAVVMALGFLPCAAFGNRRRVKKEESRLFFIFGGAGHGGERKHGVFEPGPE